MQNTARTRVTPSRDTDAEVGRRIHMLMWDQQLTQAALGARVGIEQSGLAKKLRGQRGWALSEIVAVADVLDVSIASLFGEGPEAPLDPNRGAEDYRVDAPVVSLSSYRTARAV